MASIRELKRYIRAMALLDDLSFGEKAILDKQIKVLEEQGFMTIIAQGKVRFEQKQPVTTPEAGN
jgi:hypothetical protein